MKSRIKHFDVFVKDLISLERKGKYEEAVSKLEEIWGDLEQYPDVQGLDDQSAAEILLRCGSLIGFLGQHKQLPDSQEKSKNLLTQARKSFIDFHDAEKVAECENYLSLAYHRTGQFSEAITWVDEALSADIPLGSPTKLYSFVIKSMIFIADGKSDQAISLLDESAHFFNQCGDDFLKGCYFTHLGAAFGTLGNKVLLLENQKKAQEFHQKSGHQVYLATIENNIAYHYQLVGDFASAHRLIDSALAVFRQMKDRTREGFSLDTKAHIFFDEQRYSEALETINLALSKLETSENAHYLVETNMTKMKILLAQNEFSDATLCLFEAVATAKNRISEDAAKNLVNEFENLVKPKLSIPKSTVFTAKELKSGDLELSLPASISHFNQYQAVRIRNTHLQSIGLTQDSLAIVVDEKVTRGDLAAVMEISDGSIYCGFFDAEFGIICLDGINSEPHLFNESEAQVLGKIVGVCDNVKDENGRLPVRLIKFR